MNSLNRQFALLLCVCSFLVGCQKAPKQIIETEAKATLAPSDAIDDGVKARAIAAKDAMFKQLSGRLMEVMKSDGPGAAIEVCSNEAAKFATQVGEQQGVKIGRTALKLRNAKNQSPAWAEGLLSEELTEPHFVSIDADTVGALLPIKLQEKCLTCHGARESLASPVKEQLAKFYPDDAATGFKEGDLRGWFWVEVPRKVTNSADSASIDQDAAGETGFVGEEHQHDASDAHGPMHQMGRHGGGMAERRADMTTLHSMFADREKIVRKVTMLTNGAEAITESDEASIVALIQEHVPAMEDRVHSNEPLPPMTFHPIFVELIKHADDYELSYEETDKGMKVTYEADDPFVIMLVQEHAKLVSRFIKNGMQEIHAPYKLPSTSTSSDSKGYSTTPTGSASP